LHVGPTSNPRRAEACSGFFPKKKVYFYLKQELASTVSQVEKL
jgi:hypothetical protein